MRVRLDGGLDGTKGRAREHARSVSLSVPRAFGRVYERRTVVTVATRTRSCAARTRVSVLVGTGDLPMRTAAGWRHDDIRGHCFAAGPPLVLSPFSPALLAATRRGAMAR